MFIEQSKLISIVVPVFNTAEFLSKCLDSLVSQTYKNIEIIVVNDGSTDNSLEIIKNYSLNDSRIIILNKKNGGLSSARNAGIDASTGDYIMHVDSDDWVDHRYCQKLMERAINDSSDIVVAGMYYVYPTYTRKIKPVKIDTNDVLSVDRYLELWKDNLLLSNACHRLISSKLYKSHNIRHPESISLGEDLVTTPRLCYFSNKISVINESYYYYRQNPSSIMNDGVVRRIYEMIDVFNILDEFFIENDKVIDTSYLKVVYLSSLISCDYDIFDEYYNDALYYYIGSFVNLKKPARNRERILKLFLIKTALKIRPSIKTIELVRKVNIASINIKNKVTRVKAKVL